MNNSQGNNQKSWSNSDKSIFSYTYKKVSSDLQKNDTACAEARVNWFASRVQEDSKKNIWRFIMCCC